MKAIAAALPVVLCDVVGLAGAGSLSYGAWLIYQPAGYITGGLLLVAGAITARLAR